MAKYTPIKVKTLERMTDIVDTVDVRYCGKCRSNLIEHISLTPAQGKAYGRDGSLDRPLDFYNCRKCGEPCRTLSLLELLEASVSERGTKRRAS